MSIDNDINEICSLISIQEIQNYRNMFEYLYEVAGRILRLYAQEILVYKSEWACYTANEITDCFAFERVDHEGDLVFKECVSDGPVDVIYIPMRLVSDKDEWNRLIAERNTNE